MPVIPAKNTLTADYGKDTLLIYNQYWYMKTTIIQLEEFDSPTSIKEKINGSTSQRVLVVWPNNGYIQLTDTDILLIFRFAEELGVQVAVVLDDPIVIRQLKELGVSTFASIPEAQKKPWRKPKISKAIRRTGEYDNKKVIENYLQFSKTTPKTIPPFFRWFLFLIAIISFLLLFVMLIPSATVSLTPNQELQEIGLPLRSDPSVNEVSLSGAIPGRIEVIEIEGQMEGESSGIIRIPENNAVGEVKFTNLSDRQITIPKGTVVRTENEPFIRFQTTETVVINPGVIANKLVEIVCLVGGTVGNVQAKTIKTIEDDFGGNLSVINNEPTTGGVDIKTFSPSENDYSKSKDDLIQTMHDLAYDDFQKEFSDQYFIPEDSIVLEEIIDEERLPEVGDPAERYVIKIKAEFSAWLIEKNDMDYLSNVVLNSDIQSDFSPLDGSLHYEINKNSIEFEQNSLVWEVTASQKIYHNINQQQIIQKILGKHKDQAASILMNELNLEDPPEIFITPTFWTFLPYLPFRINVVIDGK